MKVCLLQPRYSFDEKDLDSCFQELLGLPENIKPNALVVVGYPAKIPLQPSDRFDSSKVHYEKW